MQNSIVNTGRSRTGLQRLGLTRKSAILFALVVNTGWAAAGDMLECTIEKSSSGINMGTVSVDLDSKCDDKFRTTLGCNWEITEKEYYTGSGIQCCGIVLEKEKGMGVWINRMNGAIVLVGSDYEKRGNCEKAKRVETRDKRL